ncbi:hypothetical protein KEX41_28620 (plasmid) [Burkholderia thailandensis]|uniref:hypothetical protein n=1 Tax=Burkholderia thailandensis TaxID=57975 RepID=UPI00192D79F4|nr:hypothetical protein [Burkholderia thailandensis]MBS2132151.1 hypothetical protein [Burkholderia thailandensis]QRA15254.1 hypothetical protein JMY07_29045 [Burkholderia thailandensis]
MNDLSQPPAMVGKTNLSWLRRALRTVGLTGENPHLTSKVDPGSITAMRIVVGLIVLYDAWASLSWSHKQEMAQFLGVGMESAWLALTVAVVSFVKLAIAASLLSGRGVQPMGWVGVIYGLVVWIVMEHGGDFGQGATDPGLGFPYVILFLYLIGADRLRSEGDASANEILSLARVAFGLLWAYDAALKFQPYFLNHYIGYLNDATNDVGAQSWQGVYDHAWTVVSIAIGAKTVAVLVGLTEALIAVSLISGRGLRLIGPIGIALSLAVWTTAEEWGGPYSLGITSNMPMRLIGVAIIYAITFGYVWLLYNPRDLFSKRKA